MLSIGLTLIWCAWLSAFDPLPLPTALSGRGRSVCEPSLTGYSGNSRRLTHQELTESIDASKLIYQIPSFCCQLRYYGSQCLRFCDEIQLAKGIAIERPDCVNGAPSMTVDDFRQSLTADRPPADLTLALAGLWWDAKGDWTQAHASA